MTHDPTELILLYFIVPVWLIAGMVDWFCHRASGIGRTTGAKESLIHLLMFAEVGLPVLAGLFLQINAGVIALMIVAFFVHEATALWDVSYAVTARVVTPIEQHVHSFLEMVPLMAIIAVASIHWPQFLALFGGGTEPADWALHWKSPALPVGYIVGVLAVVVFLEFVPYLEELWRGWRQGGRRLMPEPARRAAATGTDTLHPKQGATSR
ncbi:diguanylate cyclase [Mitsuaria sp. 7]|uniref:diguanylate cyclase n=1 Tax=Mitsuaria sp. 7 TaxID=1658665 RepID=UPI0007DDF416|nr:diguanylate cyclase [Mitsuaria sp. 7]ANH68974.1 diguanylate cyclase [Mitsuaria sp. 7]